MIEKVKRILGLSKKKQSNLLLINVEKLERRVALLEDGVLEEYNVERVTDRNIVGGIFKGRVKNIEPGLKAMFVDIGYEKNAFLHFWDALPGLDETKVERIDRGDKGGGKKNQGQKKPTAKDIPTLYPVGSEVLVQVTKGPIGTKGPRVTTNLSLAGRYLVLMPYSDGSGISRKIEDPKERDRLRKILRALDIPDGMGVIMRTAGEGQRARFFVRDLSLLLEQWATIDEGKRTKHAPACLFEEPEPHRAHRARFPHRRGGQGDLRRSRQRRAHENARRADLLALQEPALSTTPSTSRSSTSTAYSVRSTTRSTGRSGSSAAATSCSTKPRRSLPST